MCSSRAFSRRMRNSSNHTPGHLIQRALAPMLITHRSMYAINTQSFCATALSTSRMSHCCCCWGKNSICPLYFRVCTIPLINAERIITTHTRPFYKFYTRTYFPQQCSTNIEAQACVINKRVFFKR